MNMQTEGLVNTRKLATLAVLSAIAYVAMLFFRFPVVLFLKYEPKDVIITIAGFIFGPLSAFAVSAMVSMVEMVTVSEAGVIGLLMNVMATCAFACSASFIYKKKQSFHGAAVGLLIGCILMTAVMLLWNYFVTPFYMGVPREEVIGLLVPAILPFNLIKGGLNAVLTLFLYKPLVTALRKSHLIQERTHQKMAQENGKVNLGVILVALFVLLSCIMMALALQGII